MWLSPVIVVLFLLTTPLWVYLARKNPHTRVVLLTGWLPVIMAMAISRYFLHQFCIRRSFISFAPQHEFSNFCDL